MTTLLRSGLPAPATLMALCLVPAIADAAPEPGGIEPSSATSERPADSVAAETPETVMATGEEGQPPSASADVAEAVDPALLRARSSFRLGVALAREGQWAEAIRALRRSEAFHTHPVTTYNIGYVERALGHYARAWSEFTRALRQDAAGPERLPPDLEKLTRAYLSDVESRLARVSIVLAPEVTTVSVDGQTLVIWDESSDPPVMLLAPPQESESFRPPQSFELVLDAGTHIFVLSRPDAQDFVMRRSFEAGTRSDLTLAPSPDPSPSATPAQKRQSEMRSATRDRDSGAALRTWAWISYGVGGVGLAAGAAFLVHGYATANSLENDPECSRTASGWRCPNTEPYISDNAWVERDEILATVGFGLGIAGALTGSALLLFPAFTDDERTTGSLTKPYLGLGTVGIHGRY